MALLDIINVAGQSVRIYSVVNRGESYAKLSYNWAGEWRARLLRNASEDDARRIRGIAREIATAMAAGREDQIHDISEGIKQFRHGQEWLADSGVPVDVACREYSRSLEILAGRGTVIDAAEFFVRRNPSIAKEIAMRDAVEEFIAAQKKDGASEKYLQDMRARLRRFARENGGFLSESRASQLKIWLRGLNVQARTRNNFVSLLKTFFNWAKSENYLPRGVATEMDEVAKIAAPSEICIHDADTVAEIMAGAIEHDPRCIPYLACGYFAAIRPREMQRMDASNIRFKHNDIEVRDWQAKNTRSKGHRRLIPMQPNLVTWLSQFPIKPRHEGEQFALLATSSTRNRTARLVRKLGVEWHHDVMRHTAISNMVALTQNVDQVALWAGNSRQVIYQNYLNQVTPKEAKLFFSIAPPDLSKILRLERTTG